MTELTLLPEKFVTHHSALVDPEGRICSTRAFDVQIYQMLCRVSGGQGLVWHHCSDDEFTAVKSRLYDDIGSFQSSPDAGDDLSRILQSLPTADERFEGSEDAPVIRFINQIISSAVQQKASDIHIETFRSRCHVRFRVDGMLYTMFDGDQRLAAPLVSRLKIMSGLDIAERRLPQDGRIQLTGTDKDTDIRVSVIPVIEGERVVLRLLNRTTTSVSISGLGIAPEMLAALETLLSRPYGMILTTGPTGSGKSTSLYAFLKHLQAPHKNILTIEDPVEYLLEGISQTQVNPKAGMTFSKGLRSILRQDPDVILVGEIRDSETAGIAIQSALTGHLVLSSLHTDTAVGAISRLRDMRVEPFVIASALSGVISQRLVRCLCPECKRKSPMTPYQTKLLSVDSHLSVYEPTGCSACQGRGYLGRTGIYEMLLIDGVLRGMIHDGASGEDISRYMKTGATGIFDDAREKILAGVTSLDEVLRVTESGL